MAVARGAGRAARIGGDDAGIFETLGEGLGTRDPGGRKGTEGIELAIGRPGFDLLGVTDEIEGVQSRGGRRENEAQD
jgi:hypothetical protein